MPLSDPTPREAIHTRRIECRGYRREDGLWDIEGEVHDSKTYGFDNSDRGRVEAGEPVHHMRLRLTVDDELNIHRAEAASDAFPFAICPDITPNFARLEGLRIMPGWTREVRRRLGGAHGCTHLVELLGPVATTAYQTIFPSKERKERTDPDRKKPGHLDTCHALASDGPVVKSHWPEFYTGGER